MAAIKYDVIVSDAALSMLDGHVIFLARVNRGAAIKLMDEIVEDIASLSEHPRRFPVYENSFVPHNRYRRMLTAKRYLVIYEIDGTTVYVDYIIDCRQDYSLLIQ